MCLSDTLEDVGVLPRVVLVHTNGISFAIESLRSVRGAQSGVKLASGQM